MRYVVLSFLSLMTACVGKVDGDPWTAKTAHTSSVAPTDCQQVRGSKYTVCGVIDGQLGATSRIDSIGTTYNVRGGSYAQ